MTDVHKGDVMLHQHLLHSNLTIDSSSHTIAQKARSRAIIAIRGIEIRVSLMTDIIKIMNIIFLV